MYRKAVSAPLRVASDITAKTAKVGGAAVQRVADEADARAPQGAAGQATRMLSGGLREVGKASAEIGNTTANIVAQPQSAQSGVMSVANTLVRTSVANQRVRSALDSAGGLVGVGAAGTKMRRMGSGSEDGLEAEPRELLPSLDASATEPQAAQPDGAPGPGMVEPVALEGQGGSLARLSSGPLDSLSPRSPSMQALELQEQQELERKQMRERQMLRAQQQTEEALRLGEVFQLFDSDSSGKIDSRELHAALRQSGLGVTQADVDDLVARLDTVEQDGELDFNEFCAAFQDMQAHEINEHSVRQALVQQMDVERRVAAEPLQTQPQYQPFEQAGQPFQAPAVGPAAALDPPQVAPPRPAPMPIPTPTMQQRQKLLVLHGPKGQRSEVKSTTEPSFLGRGMLGLDKDGRISRKHLQFSAADGEWTVSLKSANPAWLRSAGEAFESELTKGDAPHRLQDGDTLYLVACDDDHAVRVELREPAAAGAPPQDGLVATPQQHADALVPMSAGQTVVRQVNPLAGGGSVLNRPPMTPVRPQTYGHLEEPLSAVKGSADLIDDMMVMKSLVPVQEASIRFGEVFFEETRRVTPYLYVPKGVPVDDVLPAMIRCFQLQPPPSILDVLPHRAGHDHYLNWTLDVMNDPSARSTWRWRDEDDPQAGLEESHRQQCMRQFGDQVVEAAMEVVNAVGAAGGWFCTRAGRDASQQLLGHAIDEAHAGIQSTGSGDYVWLGLGCASRLCWSRQLRQCSRALDKREKGTAAPAVKRRFRYPKLDDTFLDHAARWDRDLERRLDEHPSNAATREQLQWSVIDPHTSHLVVFEDTAVEDQLRSWAQASGIQVDETSPSQSEHSQMNESTPASPRVPDKMAGLSTFSLTPDSFLPPQQMGSGQAIRLDYWSCAQPIEERMWNQFRDTFRKLGVRAGCLVTHCAGGHDRAIALAEEGMPVISLEDIGNARLQTGIEGDAAKQLVAAPRETFSVDVEEPDIWVPKKGLAVKAANLRVSLHEAATEKTERSGKSSPQRNSLSYKEMAFGVRSTDGPQPEPEPEPEPYGTSAPMAGLADMGLTGTRKGSLPDDGPVDDPNMKNITIIKGSYPGFGFAVDDACIVSQTEGAAKDAGVSVGSRVARVEGNSVQTKQDIIRRLQQLGQSVQTLSITFQLPPFDRDLQQASQGLLATPQPVRPSNRSARAPADGPQVMLRLVRVKVSEKVFYTSELTHTQLKEALEYDDAASTELEKQERNWDKQVVGKAWDAYATLRFNAEKARIRNQLLQNVSTFMHVFVALMACLTITQEVHLEDGVQATYDAQGDPYNGPTLLDNWSVKNSLFGNMHDSIWAWFSHGLNFVGPCVLIAVMGLQADWSDDVRWGGHLLRAERLRAAIYGYRGQVGDWKLEAAPTGGWWHEQLAGYGSSAIRDLGGVARANRNENRERLNTLYQDTLTAAMTRSSNTAADATIPAVMVTGVVLCIFGLGISVGGIAVELQYDDRPLAILLLLCGITAIVIGVTIVKPLANQASTGKSRDIKPLREHTPEFALTCAPPFKVTVHDRIEYDDGHGPLDAERFLQYRAYPLRAELGTLGPLLSARLRRFQRMLFLSTFLSAMFAICAPTLNRHLAVWVCLFNTAGCSVIAWSNRTSARELACAAQTTCVTLDQILDWWLALPKESQASQKSYEQLVQDVERAVEVLCIIWTRCELELPRTIHCDGHLDVDRERLRQLDSATRDKDAMLRNQVQPGVGLNLRI